MSDEGKLCSEIRAAVKSTIVESFVVSATKEGFNGISGESLLSLTGDENLLKEILAELVTQDGFSISFAVLDINPHIKRLPELEVIAQIDLLQKEKLSDFCVYPSAAAVIQHPEVPNFRDRPFSEMLLLGKAQLDFVGFELQVLSRYSEDPRYALDFEDYMGHMSITDRYYHDDEFVDRDKVGLQTFGLGFDNKRDPVVVVFLRYLADLSPEHQQYWNSFKLSGEIVLSRPYYISSIEGQFWENRSLRFAISEEIRLVRQMTLAAWGAPLFRQEIPTLGALELTAFQLPTSKNFELFVHSLDKALSENLDRDFFKGKVRQKDEIFSNSGEREVRNRGSLAMLQEWLLNSAKWESESRFKEVVMQPLLTVRNLRQKPAHSFTTNSHSENFTRKRKELLWSVYNSLANMRRAFQTHPDRSSIEVPYWLDSERIDVF